MTSVSILTDFGLDDEFVGVLHAVIARGAPAARIIDITHAVPPHDVRAGAMTLWRSTPWLAPGVILAVVDPGVGTDRRAVAVEVAGAGAVFVGPDNGLLLPAIARLGGASAAVELAVDDSLAPPGAGATFAGRDVFAPAAARVAAGQPVAALGRAIDPGSLLGQPVPRPESLTDGSVRAEVLWIDHFGNAQLNVAPAELGLVVGDLVDSTAGATVAVNRVVSSYGEIADGEVALVVDSYGLLAFSCNRESAASRLGLAPGANVRVTPRRPPGAQPPAVPAAPVR